MKFKSPVKIGCEIECGLPTVSAPAGHCRTNPVVTGWDRGNDGDGIEWRFLHPANTLEEAFKLLDDLHEHYFGWAEVKSFGASGTHIHLGLVEFLKAKYKLQEGTLTRYFYGYFVTRERAISDTILSEMRHRNGNGESIWGNKHPIRGRQIRASLCDPNQPPYCYTPIPVDTPLMRIHNEWAGASRHCPAGMQSGAIQYLRKNLPTFEFRFFEGTSNMEAVKGYICLLINMLIRAEIVIDRALALDELGVIEKDKESPGVFVQPFKYETEDLIAEVKETPFFGDELASWIKATVKNKGNPTTFEYDKSSSSDDDYLTAEAKRYATSRSQRVTAARA